MNQQNDNKHYFQEQVAGDLSQQSSSSNIDHFELEAQARQRYSSLFQTEEAKDLSSKEILDKERSQSFEIVQDSDPQFHVPSQLFSKHKKP